VSPYVKGCRGEKGRIREAWRPHAKIETSLIGGKKRFPKQWEVRGGGGEGVLEQVWVAITLSELSKEDLSRRTLRKAKTQKKRRL